MNIQQVNTSTTNYSAKIPTNNKSRILYLDAIKAILIFIVIWGHAIQYTNSTEGLINPIASFLYSFHMPMFMALSGVFFHKTLTRDFKTVIKKKSIQLLLPSTLLLLLLFTIIFVHKPRSLNESIYWLWIARPWYVYTLFTCTIVSYIFAHYKKGKYLTFVLAFCFFVLIPDISDREIFLLPYFALGHYWDQYKDNISPQCENITLIICIPLYVFLLLIYFNTGGGRYLSFPLDLMEHTRFFFCKL